MSASDPKRTSQSRGMRLSATLAATIVLIPMLFVCFGVWWAFFRDDGTSQSVPIPSSEAEPISSDELNRIEAELQVSLPAEYRTYVGSKRQTTRDCYSILDSADSIIEATRTYRAGLEDLPRWPKSYLYVGDEADACPYALDTATGSVSRLDKGDISRSPLERYQSFLDFLSGSS